MRGPLHAEIELVRSTIAGSTAHRAPEVAAFVALQLGVLAAQQAAGQRAGQQARQRSERARSAIRQAAGLEAMKGGPLAGKQRAVLPLSTPKWAATVVARIGRDPGSYGVDQAPSVRLAELVLAELRKESTAAK